VMKREKEIKGSLKKAWEKRRRLTTGLDFDFVVGQKYILKPKKLVYKRPILKPTPVQI